MFQHLAKDQIYFILKETFIDHRPVSQTYEKVTDPDSFAKYGVLPCPRLSKNYLYRLLQPEGRLGKNSIHTQTFLVEWRAALDDERLTHVRSCIQELTAIVDSPTSSNQDKINAIKQIRAMVGTEDASIKAVEKSGQTTVNIQETLLKRILDTEEDVC